MFDESRTSGSPLSFGIELGVAAAAKKSAKLEYLKASSNLSILLLLPPLVAKPRRADVRKREHMKVAVKKRDRPSRSLT